MTELKSNVNNLLEIPISKSKFLCPKCEELFYVEDLCEHSAKCDSEKSLKETTGICNYCYTMVRCPETEHIRLTKFRPPECEVFRANCPNCKLKDVKIKEHFNICPNKPKECDLSKLGCTGKVAFDSRQCTFSDGHRRLLDSFLKRISVRINDFTKLEFDQSIDAQEIERISNDIKIFKESIYNRKLELNAQRSGTLIWRIENAKDFLTSQTSEISSPVYTSDYGYKLCLKAYPNGDGIGAGTHLSLYFAILKGEYDNLLAWPFKCKVKILLFNRDFKNQSKYEIYKPNESKPFQQPENVSNVATGNPKFIKLEAVKNDGFIIDNCLFIELSVDQKKTYL